MCIVKFFGLGPTSDYSRSAIYRSTFFRQLAEFEKETKEDINSDPDIRKVVNAFNEHPNVNFYIAHQTLPDFDHSGWGAHSVSEKVQRILKQHNQNDFLRIIKTPTMIAGKVETRFRITTKKEVFPYIDQDLTRVVFSWSHNKKQLFKPTPGKKFQESSWAEKNQFLSQDSNKHFQKLLLINFKFKHADHSAPSVFAWRKLIHVSEQVKEELTRANCTGISYSDRDKYYEELKPILLDGGRRAYSKHLHRKKLEKQSVESKMKYARLVSLDSKSPAYYRSEIENKTPPNATAIFQKHSDVDAFCEAALPDILEGVNGSISTSTYEVLSRHNTAGFVDFNEIIVWEKDKKVQRFTINQKMDILPLLNEELSLLTIELTIGLGDDTSSTSTLDCAISEVNDFLAKGTRIKKSEVLGLSKIQFNEDAIPPPFFLFKNAIYAQGRIIEELKSKEISIKRPMFLR